MTNIHLITSLESGGVQKVLYEYLKSLNSSRLANTIVYSLKGFDYYSTRIHDLGVKVIHLNKKRYWFQFIIHSIFSFGYLKAWMYHSCIFSTIAKLNIRKKIFWSIHHGELDFKTDGLSTIFAAYISSILSWFIPKKIVFESKTSLNKHIKYGFPKKKSIVVYNNVNRQYNNVYSNERNGITFIGRNHPNKNLDLFLKACKKVEFINKKHIFHIVGKGTELITSNYNLNPRYHIHGELANLESIYLGTDIYICTSYTESFGLTIIEAILSGCTVICPDDEVFKEVTLNQVIYYQQDNLDSLVEKIIYSMNSFPNNDFIEKIKYKYCKSKTTLKLVKLLCDN